MIEGKHREWAQTKAENSELPKHLYDAREKLSSLRAIERSMKIRISDLENELTQKERVASEIQQDLDSVREIVNQLPAKRDTDAEQIHNLEDRVSNHAREIEQALLV